MGGGHLPTGHRHHRAIVGINVTPMVDVMLVLLVIFIVTARLVATNGLPLDLPRAARAEEVQVLVAVSLSADGRMVVDEAEVETLEQLGARAAAQVGGNPQARVVIAADGAVQHRRVMAVMDALRSVGIDRIAFAAEPVEEAPIADPARRGGAP